MVEPELPASSGRPGAVNPLRPRPWIISRPSLSSTAIPRDFIQLTVERQSLLVAKPRIWELPEATEASIATRCEIDLSPGTEMIPATGDRPLILIDLDIATTGMLHNVAHCDHLVYELAPRFNAFRKGIPSADD
jgi:hypothetical protein